LDENELLEGSLNLSIFSLVAIAYHFSVSAPNEEPSGFTKMHYLSKSIELEPNEATSYYFRALRRSESLRFQRAEIRVPELILEKDIISDLSHQAYLEGTRSSIGYV